jgi:hypothetical protein
MAFIAEDGTGLANANSLISVEDADTYFSDRGNTEWDALTTASKQAALIKATDYLNAKAFIGYNKTNTQSLKFPRELESYYSIYSGVDISEMPAPILNAVCELALAATDSELYSDVTTSGNVKSESKSLDGVGSKTVEYMPVSSVSASNMENKYGKVESLIKPYLKKRATGFSR